MYEKEAFMTSSDGTKDYRFILMLTPDYHCLKWTMLAYEKEKNDADEKKFQKNEKKLGWKPICKKIPKECEIIFSKLKDDIFEEINRKFYSELNQYKSKKE